MLDLFYIYVKLWDYIYIKYKANYIIMNNTLRIVTTSGILLLALFYGYYFQIFLPQYQQQLFANKLNCNNAGEKTYQMDTKFYAAIGVLEEPSYSYNSTLNTCLYESGYMTPGGSNNFYNVLWVKDSLTNATILGTTFYSSNSDLSTIENYIQFQQDAKNLMGEVIYPWDNYYNSDSTPDNPNESLYNWTTLWGLLGSPYTTKQSSTPSLPFSNDQVGPGLTTSLGYMLLRTDNANLTPISAKGSLNNIGSIQIYKTRRK